MTTALRPIALISVLLATTAQGADSPQYPVVEPPKSWNLDPFYKKCVLVDGLPVVSSEKVSDYALKEAAYLIGRMLEGRKDVIDVMVKNRVRVAVMAYSERTVNVPEHREHEARRLLEPPGQRARAGGRPVAARKTCSTIRAIPTPPRTS